MNRLRSALAAVFLVSVSSVAMAAAPTLDAGPTATPKANGDAGFDATVTTHETAAVVHFRYGLTTSYGSEVTVAVNRDSAAKAISAGVSGLIGGATYHYQAFVTSAGGDTTPTADATFVEPAYAPTVTIKAATDVVAGKAKLHAAVTANGTAGATVHFEYGPATFDTSTPDQAVAATDNAKTFDEALTGLTRGQTFSARAVVNYDDNGTAKTVVSNTTSFTTNIVPVAKDDTTTYKGTSPLVIDVLANDTDGDSDPLYISAIAQQPKNGTAAIKNGKIEFTPNSKFTGDDSFKYTIEDGYGGSATATVKISDTAPVAVDDAVTLSSLAPKKIAVLANDSDAEKDTLTIVSVTSPSHGSATISGKLVTYTPGGDFSGRDSFTYTIRDGSGKTATATVTVRSARVAGAGQHSTLIKDADGKVVGVLRFQSLPGGSFSGKLELNGKTFPLLGSFDADGHYRGSVTTDGTTLPVEFDIAAGDSKTEFTADIGEGKFSGAGQLNGVSNDKREELAGRFTIDLPGATSTSSSGSSSAAATTTTGDTSTTTTTVTLPEGHGWATVKLNEYGEARIRGKMGDGRAFSASAYLGGTDSAPELALYATPKSSTVTGTLKLGDKVSGTLAWQRDPTDADYYPKGFDTTVTANGARYTPPDSGKRALATDTSDAGRATITITGGRLDDIKHELRISEHDKVQVLDPANDQLNLEIDRKSGMFSGKFRFGDDNARRGKITGVLLQSDDTGRGVFLGRGRAGSVEITVSAGTTTGGGTTTPVVDPTQ